MAGNVIDWVWAHSRAVNGSLIVLLAIAHEADRDGNTAMSVRELAQKTRLSERSVQNATTELTRSRELAVRAKGGDHGRNGYRVIMIRGADSAPLSAGKGAISAPPDARRGADIAPPQILHPADSAPLDVPSAQVNHVNPANSAPLEISDMVVVTTGREEVQVKPTSEIVRSDVESLCDHLADRIAANGSRRPAIGKKWRDAARLMLDNDGRTEQQVHAAIDWCQDSEFWRANILSMPKLREKYEQLRLRAQAARNGNGNGSTTNARVRAGLDLAEKYALQERQLP